MTQSSAKTGHMVLKLSAPALLLALGACATPFRADVARFQELPAPTGQSFVVMTSDPKLEGGIEFSHYSRIVADRMQSVGYVPASDPASADMVVSFSYGRDKGKEKIRQNFSPYFGGAYYDPFYSYGYRGYRGHYGSRYRGRYRHRSAFVLGFHDPFLYGGHGFGGYGDIESFTVYTSHIDMKIDRVADNKRLFEGKAEAQSRSKNLSYLVPNLIEAMFTGFPGNSGETVRISVAPEKRR